LIHEKSRGLDRLMFEFSDIWIIG